MCVVVICFQLATDVVTSHIKQISVEQDDIRHFSSDRI